MPSEIAAEQDQRDQELKELILSVLRDKKLSSVKVLVGIVLARSETDDSSAHSSAQELIRLVQELKEEGKIYLSEPPQAFTTFGAYLLDRNASLSFWLVSVAVLLTWVSIFALPSEFPWVIPRWVLGTLFVVFLPGYAFIESLFVNPLSSRKELDEIERFALSMGMSLALVPLVGLLLNYTPWGIRLEPIVISLSILTLACIFVATYRKFARSSEALVAEGTR